MAELFQKPDEGARRKTVLLIFVSLFLGLFAYWATQRFVDATQELATEDPDAAVARLALAMKLLGTVTSLIMVAIAGGLFRFSLTVYRGERFPPLDSRIIRDTRILRGKEARARAWIGFALAALIAGVGTTGGVLLWRMATLLLSP
jgi:hypothetical protein